MTIRNLENLLKPKSIALIGASKQPMSIGATLAQNLFSAGFDGPVMPVNPKYRVIEGVITYPDVASLPETPELAVISTPAESVPTLIQELGARGTRAAIIISAGFGEGGEPHGKELRQAALDAAKPHLLRILGPNCLGLMVPEVGLNASFAPGNPIPGRLAFVAQSGAMVTSVLDWARSGGIGFSYLVSLGDMSDVDFADMIDYLANDAKTQAILLYIEHVAHPRKFMSAARAAARMKPVIVVKGGRYAEAARAVASHTGALAGNDAVYDAVFRRSGMLRVTSLEDLFAAVETLAMTRVPQGDRLAILTNGGGMGVLATDALIARGGHLAELSQETLVKLDEILPKTWSRGNPIDIVGDAPPSRYADALRELMKDRGVDAVLVLNCPTAVAAGIAPAQAVIDARGHQSRPILLTSWVGGDAQWQAGQLLARHGIATYHTPERAVAAFMHIVDYRRNQEALMETPPSVPEAFTPDLKRARTPMTAALAEGRDWLLETEAKEVLAAYGVPVIAPRVAKAPWEAAAIAAEIGGPVALKILSPDITHKSDVGGVVLDLAGPAAVRDATELLQETFVKHHPEARLSGFTVAPMVRRPGAYELIVGLALDPQFGPVVLFGHGGTEVEVVNDKALGLPALNMHLALEMMSRTRIYRLLKGYRGMPSVDLDAIALSLIKIAQAAIDHPEIVELDINPLLADEFGVLALDARIRVAKPALAGAERLAIRPYPNELEENVPLGDGRTLLLRPIRPEDEPSLRATFSQLSPEQIRLRFFVPMKTLSHITAARFTQIDYDREMALILTDPGIAGKTEIYGVVRIFADPDNERAEYAIIVRGDMTGMGLGVLLMRRIIDYAQSRGIKEIFGDVLRENSTMLKLCQALKFTRSTLPDEPEIVRVSLTL
ncbi:MAG: bifunctional acetate--CoA ligase family protein/GNAT family N-acetyltransferase [Gammaproteobacteria bacterium]